MARDTSTSTPSRRTVARTAAWSALVLATAAASPVFAASAVPDLLPVIDTANANSYDTYSVVSHLYGIVNFGPVPTNGTTPIQLFIAKADVPYSGYVTATTSDPNWTLVEETTAGFLFSYNAAVPIAAGGGLTSMIEVGVYQFTQMTQPLNLTASIPGAAGGETDTSNNSTTTTLQPTYVPTTTNELAAFSSIDLVLTYTIVGNPEGLGFFAEVATQGDLRDDNNYSGWLNLTRA